MDRGRASREDRGAGPPVVRGAAGRRKMMHFVGWNLVLCSWLVISAFVFAQPPFSVAQTTLTAVIALAFAYLAPSRPNLRFVISVLAVLLGLTAVLMPGLSTPAIVNNATMALLLLALSLLVRPVVTSREGAHFAKP
jgi:hypothetical protein